MRVPVHEQNKPQALEILLSRIECGNTREAFLWLIANSARFSDLHTKSNARDGKCNFDYKIETAVLFAFTTNTHHLLFYLRKPFFDRFVGLKDRVKNTFSSYDAFGENNSGELRFKIRNLKEAEQVQAFLENEIG